MPVLHAFANPARFHLMWRKALLNTEDPAYAEAGHRAFLVLDGVVRGEEAARTTPPRDLSLAPSIACWSIVHGFAMLALDGAFGAEPGAADRAAEALLPLVLDHLAV